MLRRPPYWQLRPSNSPRNSPSGTVIRCRCIPPCCTACSTSYSCAWPTCSSTARLRHPPPEPFLRFRDAVERGFSRTHRIDDYARELGYSTRTLTRATQTAAGLSAKDYLDQRLTLEAKRLLAHGTEPASTIAAHLGFPSATHFGKFFQRHTGQTPLAFRVSQRASPPT
ncbi:helix-turn-helix domain-containing protein [Streptomyces sp. NPDC090798]|uniref:helix-turn-helix domain-containing protein n=1 Tax=Streptomyces sp. NPDC090798 TaxID=3365968 RepID=UPI0037F95A56